MTESLRLLSISGLIAALSFSALQGCGDDDDGNGGGAGSPGSGGSGGTTASGGSAGSGTGGSTASGGTAGSVSTGGTAGSGTGGSAGASAGAGGAEAGAGGAAAGAGGAAEKTCTTENDPGEGQTCADFCNDWFEKCDDHEEVGNKYADESACLTDCRINFTEEQLCCRAYHVNNTPADQHCPHAAGQTIPACI